MTLDSQSSVLAALRQSKRRPSSLGPMPIAFLLLRGMGLIGRALGSIGGSNLGGDVSTGRRSTILGASDMVKESGNLLRDHLLHLRPSHGISRMHHGVCVGESGAGVGKVGTRAALRKHVWQLLSGLTQGSQLPGRGTSCIEHHEGDTGLGMGRCAALGS